MANELTVADRIETDSRPVEQFFTLPVRESEKLTEVPSGWIDRLFARLWAWYGKQIEDKWGADVELAKSIWREDLAGLSPEQLRGGLERCRDSSKFAPSLPEFRAMCLNSKQVNAEDHWRICQSRNYQSRAHYWAVQWYGYSAFHEDEWVRARFKFPSLLRQAMIEEANGELPEMPEHVLARLMMVGQPKEKAA